MSGWISQHSWITWVFSGIGITTIYLIFRIVKKLFIKDKKIIKQVQQTGDNCNNYQARGDIFIGHKGETRR